MIEQKITDSRNRALTNLMKPQRDKLEKYILIPKEFPNRASNLKTMLETQKRLILELSRSKQTDQVNKLLLNGSDVYDESLQLIDWVHKILQGVMNDAQTLMDGAIVRNLIDDQNMVIQSRYEEETELLKSIRNGLTRTGSTTAQ